MIRTSIAVLALAAVLGGPAQAEVLPYSDSIFPNGLPAAPTEDSCDSYRCVWDARHQGNGTGQSLILTRYHGGFLMTPITHRRAHWLRTH